VRTEGLGRALLSALFVSSLLLYVAFPLLSLTSPPSASVATIWTENAGGYDCTDFEPDENVYIRGSGFLDNAQIQITITRPDNNENAGSALSDENGCFLYIYPLDGIYGTYYVTATDGINSASTTFEDRPKLEGFDRETGRWTSGNLTGWRELDWVPYRIRFRSLPRENSDVPLQRLPQ
jgi:hypothetical protein